MAAAFASTSRGRERGRGVPRRGGRRGARAPACEVCACATGRVAFDFARTSPQTRAPINLRPALVEARCFHALIGLIDPIAALFGFGARARRHQRAAGLSGERAAACAVFELHEKLPASHRRADRGAQSLLPAARGGPCGRQRRLHRRVMGRRASARPITTSTRFSARPTAAATLRRRVGHDRASVEHLRHAHRDRGERVSHARRALRTHSRVGRRRAMARRPELSRANMWSINPQPFSIAATRRAFPPRGIAGGRTDGAAASSSTRAGRAKRKCLPIAASSCSRAESFRVEAAGGGGYGDPAKRKPRSAGARSPKMVT